MLVEIKTLDSSKSRIDTLCSLLIPGGLAANCHIIKVDSYHAWAGAMREREEYQVEILTVKEKVDEVVHLIKETSSYERPQITVREVESMHEGFTAWVEKNCK